MAKTMVSKAVLAGVVAAVSGTMLAESASAQAVMYEPFGYTVGDRLIGQVNPGTGKSWLDPGSPTQPAAASDLHRILSGNVSYANLPVGQGNSLSLPNTPNGNISRIELPDPNGYTYDTANSTGNAPNGLFLSMAVTLTEDTTFTTQNYFAGFHLGVNATGMSVSNGYAGMIYLRPDPVNATNYNFGVAKNNATGAAIGWTTESYAPNETVFLAFQYQFATAAANNDDTVNLWVNPDLAGVMPGPSATSSTGFDGYAANGTPPVTTSILRSLYFRSNGTPAVPSDLDIDEVRVGLSYGDVTPAGNVYWDLNGTTAGAGGAGAPSGNWDGATANFNNNPAGEVGVFSASTQAGQNVHFAAGNDTTAPYTVAVSGTQSAHTVSVDAGNVTLDGGTLAVGTFDVSSGATGTVTSNVTGNAAGSVSKTGPGTLRLAANNTYTGGTNVDGGVLEVTKMHAGNAVSIGAAATLRILDSSPTLPAHPAGDDAFVSQPSSLTIAAGGTLDIGNNDVIINYTGGPNPIEALEALVRSGFAGEAQNGPGIISSVAAQDPNYVVGIADNAALSEPFGSGGTGVLFAGVDVPFESVLIKFTHRADLNLDGQVNFSDASIFGTNYQEGAPATWATGDVDLDGVFTFSDAAIFGTYYSESLASLPEPGALGALAVGALAMVRRRRRLA